MIFDTQFVSKAQMTWLTNVLVKLCKYLNELCPFSDLYVYEQQQNLGRRLRAC